METSRAISSEISTQMSKKFEEMQTNLNFQILDVFNASIEPKVLPSNKNAVKSQNSAKITNLDLQAGRPHPRNSSQARPQKVLQSNGLHPENVSNSAGHAENDFPLITVERILWILFKVMMKLVTTETIHDRQLRGKIFEQTLAPAITPATYINKNLKSEKL